MSESRYIVDEAGEIMDELKIGDRILRKGSINYIGGQTDIKFNFVKSNVDALDKIKSEAKYVNVLLKHIELGTGILKYTNGRIINTNGKLAKILAKDEKTGRVIVSNLIKKEIIHRNRDRKSGVYFTFNPFIAHCGKKVPKALYSEFFNTEWRKYTDEL